MSKRVLLEIGDYIRVYGDTTQGMVLYLEGYYMGRNFIYTNPDLNSKSPEAYLLNMDDVRQWEYVVPISMIDVNCPVDGHRVRKSDNIFTNGLEWDNFKKDNLADADDATNCKFKNCEWFKNIHKKIEEKLA